MTHDEQPSPTPGDDPNPLPPEIEQLLNQLTGGAQLPPELREMLAGSGISDMDPQVLGAMVAQMRSLFEGAGGEGGLDAGAVADLARKVIATDGDPVVSEKGAREVAEAVHVADLWLGPVTGFTAVGLHGVAWSRSEWVEATAPKWAELVAPVADGVSAAVHSALTKQLGTFSDGAIPAELVPPGMNPAAMLGQVESMMRRLHGSLFSMQVGQGLGALSGQLLSATEPSLPLVPAPTVALLPRNVAAFAEGLDLPASEVLLYAAVREVARARLFDAVPWLGAQLLADVAAYAAGIVIDTEGIESGLASIDPSDPEAVRGALEGRIFSPPERTPAQQQALTRLEASLALVEGWVDVVTNEAVRSTLPHADALAEAIRRRRATGGPAEQTFSALVGLELRPRRLRDAVNLFGALQARGGATLRDRAWEHPDLAPRAEDLDDLLGYVERLVSPPTDEVDAALDALLREAEGQAREGLDDTGHPADTERSDERERPGPGEESPGAPPRA